MKSLVVVFAALAFMGCSTTKKQPDSSSAQAMVPAPVGQEVPKAVSPSSSDMLKKESCESDQDQRSLEVHKKAPGCELVYTKFGKSSTVASSKHGTKHCEDSLEKIIKKLEAQKFSCHES
jgi:hypothetical protein